VQRRHALGQLRLQPAGGDPRDGGVGLGHGGREVRQGAGDVGDRRDVEPALGDLGVEPRECGLERLRRVEDRGHGRRHVARGRHVVAEHWHPRGGGPERAVRRGAGVVGVLPELLHGDRGALQVEGGGLPLERVGLGAHAGDDLLRVLGLLEEDRAADGEASEDEQREHDGEAHGVTRPVRRQRVGEAVAQGEPGAFADRVPGEGGAADDVEVVDEVVDRGVRHVRDDDTQQPSPDGW
jgi:hypothetical protein